MAKLVSLFAAVLASLKICDILIFMTFALASALSQRLRSFQGTAWDFDTKVEIT